MKYERNKKIVDAVMKDIYHDEIKILIFLGGVISALVYISLHFLIENNYIMAVGILTIATIFGYFFIPECMEGYRYFHKKNKGNKNEKN